MKIVKISPRGFCKGVIDAWDIVKKARKKYQKHKIYLIGQLVHNKNMIDEIKKENIILMDDNEIDRLSIVKEIIKNNNKNEIVIIFSAHGTDHNAIKFVEEEGVIFYDATCIYVKKTHEIIQQKIEEGKIILYIGVKNHPEAIATQAINNKKIILIENENDVERIKNKINNKNIFVTNQTTISIYDFYHISKKIKTTFSNIEIKNDICLAALERQKAIIDVKNKIDLLIIVGDKKSNNSNKLVNIGRSNSIESYLVENISDLNINWFNNKKNIGISAGASTPTWITNKVIKYIENINKSIK